MLGEPATANSPLVLGSRQRPHARFDVLFPAVYGLVFAGLGIFLQLRFFPIGDIDLETDFYADMVLAAQKLAAGHFSVHDFPFKGPLYGLLLVPMRALAGDWYAGACLLSAVSGGAGLAVAYRLVLQLFDRRTAVATTVAASLVVEFCIQSHRASTDVLFLLLSLGAISCTLQARTSMRWYAVAGALAALASLTRYNGVFLVVGTALLLAVVNPDRLDRRRRAQAFALYAGVFVLVGSPWLVANWLETGRLLATRNADTITQAFYGAPRWQGDVAAHAGNLRALVAIDPLHFVTQFGRNLVEHLWKDLTLLLGWPMALVPIVGILGLAIRPPTRRQTGLYVFAAAYWLCMGIVFYAPRFFLPMIVPYMALGFSLLRSPQGTTTPLGRFVGRRLHVSERVAAGIVAALVLSLAAVQVPRVIATERMIHARRPLYILEAARALREREHGSRARIMARKGHIAYHAGFDFSLYSTNVSSLEELVRVARSESAKYIVYSKVEYSLLPRSLFFAVTDTVPLLQEVYRGPGVRVFSPVVGGRTELTNTERHDLLLATLRAAREQRRPSVIYTALVDLGVHHTANEEVEDAATRFQEAVDVAKSSTGDPEMAWKAAVARHHLAIAELQLGRAEPAISSLRENREFFASQGAKDDVARTDALLRQALQAMEASGRVPRAQ